MASAPAQKSRNIYDAQNLRNLPGKLVMSEHRLRGNDTEVNEVYDGTGIVYDFYSALDHVPAVAGIAPLAKTVAASSK